MKVDRALLTSIQYWMFNLLQPMLYLHNPQLAMSLYYFMPLPCRCCSSFPSPSHLFLVSVAPFPDLIPRPSTPAFVTCSTKAGVGLKAGMRNEEMETVQVASLCPITSKSACMHLTSHELIISATRHLLCDTYTVYICGPSYIGPALCFNGASYLLCSLLCSLLCRASSLFQWGQLFVMLFVM